MIKTKKTGLASPQVKRLERSINNNFLIVQKKFMEQVGKYGNVHLTLIIDDRDKPRLCCIKDLPESREEAMFLAERISLDLGQTRHINCFYLVFSWQPEGRARGHNEFIVLGKRANGDVRYFVSDYRFYNKRAKWDAKYTHKQLWARADKLPASLKNNWSYQFLHQLYTTYNLQRLINFKK